MTIRLPLTVCLALVVSSPVWAVTANVVSDTYVSSANPAVNYGSLGTLSVANGNEALIQFDLSALPSGLTAASIQKATVTVFVDRVVAAGGLELDYVTQPWTETGVNFASVPGTGLQGVAPPTANVTQAGSFVTFDVTAGVLHRAWVGGVNKRSFVEERGSVGAGG